MTKHDFGIITKWLRNIKTYIVFHRTEIDAIEDEEKRADRFTELNVQEQVMNLAKTAIIQGAWQYEKRPHIHGWVYGLKDGLINLFLKWSPNAY